MYDNMIHFIHSFLSSLFFIRPFKLSFVRLFIHYLQLQCKHDVYLLSILVSPVWQKNPPKTRAVTQSCSRGTPSRVPYLSGDGFPPPVRVTPSSPGGQSPYHWAGNALDLSCTSQWSYSEGETVQYITANKAKY